MAVENRSPWPAIGPAPTGKQAPALRWLIGLVMAVLSAAWNPHAVRAQGPPAALPTAEIDEAVALARSGETELALAVLRRLRLQYPTDPPIAANTIVVLHWARRHEESFALARSFGAEKLPAWALDAAARAAAALGRPNDAIGLYYRALAEKPDDPALLAGLARALVAADRTPEAKPIAATLEKRFPDDPGVLLAVASVAEATRAFAEALRLYDRVLLLDPDNADAKRGRIYALEAVGAAGLAQTLSRDEPGLIAPAGARGLSGSHAGAFVRWGTLPPEDRRRRFAEIDLAIAMLDRNIANFRAEGPEAEADVLRARHDRVIAYRDRARMDDVVREVETLRAESAVPLPLWVTQASGDAYLALREPEKARDAYREVLRQEPNAFNASLSLVYALVETEEWDEALTLADGLNAAQPITISEPGREKPVVNPRRLQTEILAANVRAFSGDLKEATRRYEILSRAAEANVDLRLGLARVYGYRGWPEKSLAETRIAATQRPEDRGIAIAETGLAFDLRRYGAFESSLEQLSRAYPESRDLDRLHRTWEIFNKRELDVNVGYGRGPRETTAGQSFAIDTTLYSAPFARNLRAFVGHRFSTADTVEGWEDHHRSRIGVQGRGPHLIGLVELNYNNATRTEVGARASLTWNPNDHWFVDAGIELFSRDTPARASRNRIKSNAASASVAYRQSESFLARLGVRGVDFSDGNERLEIYPTATYRVYSGPTFTADLGAELSFTFNSRTDGPYYSPKRDAAQLLTLDLQHVIYRRYGTVVNHRLVVFGGNYWQARIGSGFIGGLRYEPGLRYNDVLDTGIGIGFVRRRFDGRPENELLLTGRLNWRF
jgi:biofilm PGA synthesis protein PgaA